MTLARFKTELALATDKLLQAIEDDSLEGAELNSELRKKWLAMSFASLQSYPEKLASFLNEQRQIQLNLIEVAQNKKSDILQQATSNKQLIKGINHYQGVKGSK